MSMEASQEEQSHPEFDDQLDQFIDKIRSYLDGEPLGSPKLLAANDLNTRLSNNIWIEKTLADLATIPKDTPLYSKLLSDLRCLEIKSEIALARHDDRYVTINGYLEASSYIDTEIAEIFQYANKFKISRLAISDELFEVIMDTVSRTNHNPVT